MTAFGISQPNFPGGAGQGLAWVAVSVESVDTANNVAIVRDQLTKSWPMPLDGMRPKGFAPAQGELWYVTKQMGRWTWVTLINGNAAGEQLPMTNVTGLSDEIAKIDPALAAIDEVQLRLDTAESTLDGFDGLAGDVADAMGVATYMERWAFGDKMGSMSRFHSRDLIGFDAGAVTRYVLLGPCPRGGLTVTTLTADVRLVGSGSVSVSLYVGNSVSTLVEVGNDPFPVTTLGPRQAIFGSSIVIPEGKIVAAAFSSVDTVFRFSGAAFGGVPGVLVPNTGFMFQGYNTSPFPPTNISFIPGSGMTINDSRIWCALS
jgi:hypothetical protein